MVTDTSLLHAALIGYQSQLQQIQDAMTAIRQRLGENGGGTAITAPSAGRIRKKRTMSAAARKHIAAAQKKRWAEWHQSHPKA
jgi:hypothetical protein